MTRNRQTVKGFDVALQLIVNLPVIASVQLQCTQISVTLGTSEPIVLPVDRQPDLTLSTELLQKFKDDIKNDKFIQV